MPLLKSLYYTYVPIRELLKVFGGTSVVLATSASQNIMKGSVLTLEGGSVREYQFDPAIESQPDQQIDVDVEFNDEALFTTAGFSSVAYLGAMTYYNSKFELKKRFKAIQETIEWMISRLDDAVSGLQDIEGAVIDEEIRLAQLKKNGATPVELLNEAQLGIQNIEQTLVFSGVNNIDDVQAGLIRLQHLNNPFLDVALLEEQYPLTYGSPTLKKWKRAQKLVDKKLIDNRITKGKDVDLYNFLFATPDIGTEEIWSLEAITTNFSAVIDEAKTELVNARNIAKSAQEGRAEMIATLGFSTEADASLINTVDEFLFASTTSISEAVSNATQYANELDIALDAVKKKGNEVVAIGAKASGKLASRILAAVSVWDGIYWVGTSIIDIGLNYLGVPEDQQKIPFLSDIPYIGKVFDFGEDKLGGSFIDDLIITPILDFILSPFLPEEVEATLVDGIWLLLATAATSDSLSSWTGALLNFYVDNISAEFESPFASDTEVEIENPLLKLFQLDPIAILEYTLYAVVAKIVFNGWIRPAYGYFSRQTGLGSTA